MVAVTEYGYDTQSQAPAAPTLGQSNSASAAGTYYVKVTYLLAPTLMSTTTGTASTTGTTTTLRDDSRTEASGSFEGYTLVITGGTDKGQSAIVSNYVKDATNGNIFTLVTALTSATDSTSTYVLVPPSQQGSLAGGTATGSGSTTTLVDSARTEASGFFIGYTINVVGGTDSGQTATVTGYNSSTHTLTFSPALSSSTDSTSKYLLVGAVEGPASLESKYTVASSNVLQVTAPTSITGETGWKVYVSTASGKEVVQNSGNALAASSNWTMPGTGVVTGTEAPPVSGVGDSNLTEVITHVGSGGDDRVDLTFYDWRNRPIVSKQGAQADETDSAHRPIFYYTLDNLGELIQADRYDGDGVALDSLGSTDGIPDAPSSSLRVARSTSSFDDQGRVYRSQTFSVDGSGVVSSNALTTDYFYDHRGNLVSTYASGGLVSKNIFDGVGRVSKTYSTDGGAVAGLAKNWANAMTVSGDIVLSQTEYTYDSDGNVILTVTRDRFHDDAANSTGELSDATHAPYARVSYRAFYFDSADREISVYDVGTNGGSAFTRASSSPSSSDSTHLLTTFSYAADTVQVLTLSGPPTSGSYKLVFDGQTTASTIAYNAAAATVQSALEALSNVGSGNVSVSGPAGGPYTVRFIGDLAGAAQPVMTVSNSTLAGGTGPGASVQLLLPGGDGGRMQSQTDPKGIVSKSDYDLMGRLLDSIAAFSDGVPSGSDDQITAYLYDGAGDVIAMTAKEPSGTADAVSVHQLLRHERIDHRQPGRGGLQRAWPVDRPVAGV